MEKILTPAQILNIAVNEYRFIRCSEQTKSGLKWDNMVFYGDAQRIVLFHNAKDIDWIGVEINKEVQIGEFGSARYQTLNTEAQLEAYFNSLNITKLVKKEKIMEDVKLSPAEILTLAQDEYGFVVDGTTTKNGINWNHMVTYKGEQVIKLFCCLKDDENDEYIGTEFNGEQGGVSGWEKYKTLNTKAKFSEWCRLNKIKKVSKQMRFLTPCEIQNILITEYGFKSCDSYTWKFLVEKNDHTFGHDSNTTTLCHNLSSSCGTYQEMNTLEKVHAYCRLNGIRKPSIEYKVGMKLVTSKGNNAEIVNITQGKTGDIYVLVYSNGDAGAYRKNELDKNFTVKPKEILWTTFTHTTNIYGVGEGVEYKISLRCRSVKNVPSSEIKGTFNVFKNDKLLSEVSNLDAAFELVETDYKG